MPRAQRADLPKATCGIPTDGYIHLYKHWGEGDIGVIVADNIMVKYDAMEAFGNPILQDNHDNRVEQYRKIVKAAKAYGSLFINSYHIPDVRGVQH
ncbi:hypothetical protein PV04_08944 [Phialophora macrospora]|uniref:Uncharacterized protein n=1 Tax=Phialophora macrospora TaxID=1851006 RepID=A0A0D2FVF1_9EURO|nr:hypothetical protein PV04_08944 [Phialophora macrospora]